jgi:hypothetical protein
MKQLKLVKRKEHMTTQNESKEITGPAFRISTRSLLIASLFGPLCLFGETGFSSDDFNRPNTGPVTACLMPNPIGSQYAIESGTWEIGGNGYLQASSVGGMYDKSLKIPRSKGSGFVFKIKVFHPNYTKSHSAREAGIILNYQDPDNYYLVRWGNQTDGERGTIQVVKRRNGKNQQLERVTDLDMPSDWYEWTFSSSSKGDGTVVYSVSKPDSPALIYEGSFSDTFFPDGYAGFYRTGSGTVRFDNYSLEVN